MLLHGRSYFFFLLPIVVSVACPTGPHPPLRLAGRPNRGHIGGGAWTPSCGRVYAACYQLKVLTKAVPSWLLYGQAVVKRAMNEHAWVLLL